MGVLRHDLFPPVDRSTRQSAWAVKTNIDIFYWLLDIVGASIIVTFDTEQKIAFGWHRRM